MPLDTSIPLQVQIPQFAEPIDPATRQYNALRQQALQQEMMRNQLIMQNTMEDRRREEANRRLAAATAAAEQRRKQELAGIYSQFGVTPAAIGQRGASYSGTGVSTNPFEPVRNQLVQKGFLSQAADVAELENKTLTGAKAKAELPGIEAESRKKSTDADIAALDAAVSRYIPAVRAVNTPDDAMRLTDTLYADPTLGPLLSRVAPLEQARVQAAREFAGDPVGFMRRHLLTGKELYDATVAANAPMKYSVQDTAQGVMRVPEVGTGPAIPLTDETGKPIMPVDRRSVTNINTVDTASETATKEYMKKVSERHEMYSGAPAVFENIEKAKALIPAAKGFMGTGGEGMLEAAKFLNNRFGMTIDPKGIKSAEELRSRLFMGVMDNLKKMDSQPTQGQQAALQEAVGRLGTDPNALSNVLDIMADALRTKIEAYNADVTEAEKRGVFFPYKPQIELPAKKSTATTDSLSVTTPNGKVYSFPTPEAAAQFKKAAGIP